MDLDVLDVSNVPIPPEEVRESTDDEFGQSKDGSPVQTATKLCFLGIGQGGGRISQQFWQYGYRRVCAINSAIADIKPLELPEERKLSIGVGGGAGGDPKEGARIIEEAREDIFNLARKSFGSNFDRVIITSSAGGGTGSGGVFECVNIAHDLIDKLELRGKDKDDPQVGVIIALPKESDGRKAQITAADTLKKLCEMATGDNKKISPLIIIDNQRIDKLYPKTPAGQFWGKSNHAVCSIFNLINIVAARPSKYTSFDRKDYEAILKSGILVFGAMPVKTWNSREGISTAVRDNLVRNLLVGGLNTKTGTIAGCVIVGKTEILDNELPQEYIDEGLSMLGRNIKAGSPVKHGIYAGNADGVVVYTMIGGLGAPVDRIKEMRKLGGDTDWNGA